MPRTVTDPANEMLNQKKKKMMEGEKEERKEGERKEKEERKKINTNLSYSKT